MKEHRVLKSIFERYYTDLLRFIDVKFGYPEDTEDIAQDAYFNMMKSGKAETVENARAYLYQTANNLALNRLSKAKTHRRYVESVNEEQMGSHDASTEDKLCAYEDLEIVESELKTISEKYRRTFMMSRAEGKSYKEISKELGIPVSTVEKHIIKVLKQLRKRLGKNQHQP